MESIIGHKRGRNYFIKHRHTSRTTQKSPQTCTQCSVLVLLFCFYKFNLMPPPRPAPTVSAKLRNRVIHSYNGNATTTRSTANNKRRANSLSNLTKRHKRHRQSDVDDKENQRPTPQNDFKFSPRSKPFRADADSVYSCSTPPLRSPTPRQRVSNKPPSVIAIQSLLEFQQDANLSDRQISQNGSIYTQ